MACGAESKEQEPLTCFLMTGLAQCAGGGMESASGSFAITADGTFHLALPSSTSAVLALQGKRSQSGEQGRGGGAGRGEGRGRGGRGVRGKQERHSEGTCHLASPRGSAADQVSRVWEGRANWAGRQGGAGHCSAKSPTPKFHTNTPTPHTCVNCQCRGAVPHHAPPTIQRLPTRPVLS